MCLTISQVARKTVEQYEDHTAIIAAFLRRVRYNLQLSCSRNYMRFTFVPQAEFPAISTNPNRIGSSSQELPI